MKKIGIITINGDNNYGNRLQNYALEQSIKKMGYNVETVVFPDKVTIKDFLRKIKKNLNKNYRENQKKFKKMESLKNDSFKEFRTNYLNNVNLNNNADLGSFDRFITGSDQVWNPSWHLIDTQWLRFVDSKKRFSYAASMATTKIHPSNTKKLPVYLNEMNEISVREAESVPFIKKLTGRDAKLVIDPTMLLHKEDYETLISKQNNSRVDKNNPYVLIYTLTGLSKDVQSKIKKLAEKNNWKIITVMGNEYNPDHMAYSPIEFVEAIKNAEVVLSDSFHCGVFSILMETQFILFNRTDGQPMNSRITTLLDKFDLVDQYYTNGELEDFLNIDFSKVSNKLENERKDGRAYLEYILSKPI